MTREEKIQFLRGLQDRTRSIDEIIDPSFIILVYRDDDPERVLNQTTGKYLTLEQAEAVRTKKYANPHTIVWIEKLTSESPSEQ